MEFRWTLEELKQIRDTGTPEGEKAMCDFLIALIAKKKSNLNVYAPLYKTLQHAQKYIEDWKNSI